MIDEIVAVEYKSFRTVNDEGMKETVQIAPSCTRRKKQNWYIWVKADGSGILVIDSQKLRVDLPANS